MGGGGSSQPQYNYPAPQAPDPQKTAEAQTGYNVNSAIAQNALNNVNQITPYGQVTYNQTGSYNIPGQAATAGTPATGGYWNGQAWVPTGGTQGTAATQGYNVPTYTATTKLSPLLQSLVDQSIYNARGVGGLETNLIGTAGKTLSNPLDLSYGNVANKIYGQTGANAKYQPLDLSWGKTAQNIYGLERNTLDPYWSQQQQLKDQQLANQGLTPGSQGWGYEQTQLNKNKSDAYTNAMLGAQSTASQNLQAEYNARMGAYGTGAQNLTTMYNAPLNALSSLRSSSQIAQPGVGQTAQTATGQVQPANYQGVASSNYATGAGIFNNQQQLQQQQYQNEQQQQNQMMGGLFGLGGQLLRAIPALASDRRDKADIRRIGVEPETKLPLYAYRYKDDPKTYPKVVGPMAQDVEKRYPESVGEVGGHKVIFGLGGA